MKHLRHPVKGCPWDLIQTENNLKEYIIEEAYELVDAIEQGSGQKQKEELGDLLLQIVFLSQINKEKNRFTFKDVLKGINTKLISRHPHVFGKCSVRSSEEVKKNWQKSKKQEKNQLSILSDYPDKMPALLAAKRISEQAATIGFDWDNASQALKKVEEEIRELREAIAANDSEQVSEEMGDLIFAVANVSRLLNVNPETTLKAANRKFSKRFRHLEKNAAAKKLDLNKLSIVELEELWQQTKEKR